MKKFLTFILVLAMILSVSGVALADTCTVPCDHVAAIGEEHYAKLQDAIDYAHDNLSGNITIEVLKNLTENIVIKQVVGLNLTIDGNDCTMTNSTIKISGAGVSSPYSDTLVIKSFNFVVNDTSITNLISTFNQTVANSEANSNMHNTTIDDCEFTLHDNCVAVKIRHGNNNTISNCKVYSGHSLLQNYGGHPVENVITVKDTTVNALRGISFGTAAGCKVDNCNITATGDNKYGIRGDASSANGGIVITKTSVSASFPVVVRDATESNGYTVSVGEGNTMTPGGDNDWCTVYSDNEKTKVEKDNLPENVIIPAATSAVAKIGDKPYDSLAAAVAAAEDGNTITLLDDCSGNGIVFPQDKFGTGLTIDFAGHTYTVDAAPLAGSSGTETQAFQILKGNKITLKGGELTSSKAKMLIQNYSDLNLEGMVLDGEKLDDSAGGKYVLSNNSGTVSIKDTTIKAASDGVAFDVCKYASYPAPSVTVDGSSVINGKVEISDGGSAAGIPTLEIKNGTFNGEIVDATKAEDGAKIEISGGTFSEDPSAYLEPAYVVSKNANGKYVTTDAIPATEAQDGNAKATSKEGEIVKITKAQVNALANDKSLVVTADGMTFTFSKDLLSGLLENNDGSYVAIKIKKIYQEDLNAAQHKAIESTAAKLVFTAEIYVNGEYVGDKLNDKKVQVLITSSSISPNTPSLDGYSLVYISDEGKLKIIASAKAGADKIEAELPHFSEYAVIKTEDANKIIASQNAPAPKPTVKPTEKPASSGIKVEYEGGNSFSTSKSAVPTSVEIDGVPVSFIGDGKYFTVGCIDPDAQWVTVRWNSTSVTTNFTPDVTVACPSLGIPKTGDMPVWAAIAAFFGF